MPAICGHFLIEDSFTDFIAASEYLSKSGWCVPGKIVAEGRSAGGTLIGAVGNMRPDLYAGLIAGMPFVDVLNTMLDETLPLTPVCAENSIRLDARQRLGNPAT